MSENLPEKKFKAGAVVATIWKNQVNTKKGEAAEFFSLSLDRRYKDKNDEWKSTNSLRNSDIPKAMLVLSKAYEFMQLNVIDPETNTVSGYT